MTNRGGQRRRMQGRDGSAVIVAEGLQDKPYERQGRNPQCDSGKVIRHPASLQRFIPEVIGAGATDRRDQILPQVITGNTLRTLQKQHDQPREDDDCQPVVRRFHVFLTHTRGFDTPVRKHYATDLRTEQQPRDVPATKFLAMRGISAGQ